MRGKAERTPALLCCCCGTALQSRAALDAGLVAADDDSRDERINRTGWWNDS